MKRRFRIALSLLLFTIVGFGLTSCMTYYQKTQKFQEAISTGNISEAQKILRKQASDSTGKNRILYLFNGGWLNYLSGNSSQAISYLNAADNYIDDYAKNYGTEALSLLTNANVKPYMPEDPEKVMVNYYKALSYLEQNNKSAALVEARKINIKLYEFNSKYKGKRNRYSDDPFAHLLMGLIYEADNNVNDAFIAYRNAINAYDSVFTPRFNIPIPETLKQDVIRMARANGFTDEEIRFKSRFNMQDPPRLPKGEGEVVFIWENGFGPVKDQWSINFNVLKGQGGFVNFQSSELGINFPFFIGDMNPKESASFSDLKFVRVAFPKYLIRPTVFTQASIEANNQRIQLNKAQNLSDVLVQTLKDRMLREMANSLLRLATKQALEEAVRSQNKDIGAAVGILNALTEQADTRNWQTLPSEIWYNRISLPAGEQSLKFKTTGKFGEKTHEIKVTVKPGELTFITFRSFEAGPPIPAVAQ